MALFPQLSYNLNKLCLDVELYHYMQPHNWSPNSCILGLLNNYRIHTIIDQIDSIHLLGFTHVLDKYAIISQTPIQMGFRSAHCLITQCYQQIASLIANCGVFFNFQKLLEIWYHEIQDVVEPHCKRSFHMMHEYDCIHVALL